MHQDPLKGALITPVTSNRDPPGEAVNCLDIQYVFYFKGVHISQSVIFQKYFIFQTYSKNNVDLPLIHFITL
jgi:hypothetical protein